VENIQPGQRVVVFDGKGENLVGLGRYVGEARVYIAVRGTRTNPILRTGKNAEIPPILKADEVDCQIISQMNPKIVLDDGEVVYGCQVWWEPVEEGIDAD
jgi:hypothetical protein